ncbi:MAG: hypothetical protein AB1767_08910 [Bacillota bacterium]
MDKEAPDLREVITDLKLIKDAVSKSDSIINFIDTGGALKGILLAAGLLIAAFSAVFYYLLEHYGTFEAIPEKLRVILFVLIGLFFAGVGFVKIRNFLHGARKVGFDLTVFKLLEELYTNRFVALVFPNIAVITLVSIFLDTRGHDLYITPAVAILLGLLIISMSSLFFMKEFYLLGVWLTATGLLTLFIAATLHPLVTLGITFAAGFILSSLFLYLSSPVKRGSVDDQ